MIWEAVIIVYLLMGVGFSWMADKGNRFLYKRPLHWSAWMAGSLGWPIVFLIGGRKK